MHVTRFAPSPTGLLHLGNAFAALTAASAAGPGGSFLLRIEDIDATRARREYEFAIEEDLHWLGLSWQRPVLKQSTRLAEYRRAVDQLAAQGFIYPCFCTRRQIAAEVERAVEAPHRGPGPIYPGTCRALSPDERALRIERGDSYALRLDSSAAADQLGDMTFCEQGAGPSGEQGVIRVDASILGDVVLARRDAPAAYHLAVVVDDAYQGITLVTRGQDLFAATHVQRLLQVLLGLPEPLYAHHRLILDTDGHKLSKRDGPSSLRDLRQLGWQPADVRHRVAP